MATFTSRLGVRMPDPTDLVSVTTDVNAGAQVYDAAVGYEIVTAFPVAPYRGKAVTFSNDSYRTYFSNGTSPASGSWVEILNSSGTFGSDAKMASGTHIVWATDTNIYRSAANTLKTDDALIVVGSTTLAAATATTVATSGNVTVGGDLLLSNGATIFRNKLSGTPVTIANTVTETVIATGTIPANDPVVGAIYRLTAWGMFSTTGTPTSRITGFLGGIGASNLASTGTITQGAATKTNVPWRMVLEIVCLTTGATATWMPHLHFPNVFASTSTGTTATTTGSVEAGAQVTRDSTISNTLVMAFTWGTANALNTFTCQGSDFERVA